MFFKKKNQIWKNMNIRNGIPKFGKPFKIQPKPPQKMKLITNFYLNLDSVKWIVKNKIKI
jgi:hypothetical protein